MLILTVIARTLTLVDPIEAGFTEFCVGFGLGSLLGRSLWFCVALALSFRLRLAS